MNSFQLGKHVMKNASIIGKGPIDFIKQWQWPADLITTFILCAIVASLMLCQ
jgi:hypothetical protein